MSKTRSPDWESIKEDYVNSKNKVSLKDFAEKHNVKYSTLRSRKNREKWDKELKIDATSIRNVASKSKNVATEEKINQKKENKKIIKAVEELEDADLTDKQRLFCIYYLKYFNATKAYQKAYNCDYLTANASGSRLLVNASIKEQIEKLKRERLQGIYLDSKDIVQRYIDIAFSDITDYVTFGKKEVEIMTAFGPLKDEEGNSLMQKVNYVDLKESNEIDGTIISEVSKGKDGVKIKLQDKMKALDWLSKNLPKINDDDLDLDRELLKVKIEKEKATVDKIKKEINSDKIKPISIEIIPRDSR